MKYRCQILFTTCSHFENEMELRLEEISERDHVGKRSSCIAYGYGSGRE